MIINDSRILWAEATKVIDRIYRFSRWITTIFFIFVTRKNVCNVVNLKITWHYVVSLVYQCKCMYMSRNFVLFGTWAAILFYFVHKPQFCSILYMSRNFVLFYTWAAIVVQGLRVNREIFQIQGNKRNITYFIVKISKDYTSNSANNAYSWT